MLSFNARACLNAHFNAHRSVSSRACKEYTQRGVIACALSELCPAVSFNSSADARQTDTHGSVICCK